MTYQVLYRATEAAGTHLIAESDTMTEAILSMREWEAIMHRAGLRMRDVRIEGAPAPLALGIEVKGKTSGGPSALVWIEMAAAA